MSTEVNFRRLAIRAAAPIHQHLCTPSSQAHVALPQSRWQELEAGFNRLDLTQSYGWRAASLHLAGDLDYQLRRLAADLDLLRARLPQIGTTTAISQPSAIVGDLLALQQEFDLVEIDLKRKRICAMTAGIVLEEIDLGAFQIALHWERIGAGRAYDVIATDPNCPVGRKDVTHPHVEDNQLCEGAGAPAIRAALAGGRLLDFFVLVRQILETYNGGSPYVPLRDWSGSDDVTCADCGCFTSSEETCCCERCDARVCTDCESSCQQCGRYVCCECYGLCSKCSQSCCQSCLNEVPGRSGLICDACVTKQEDQQDADHQSEGAEADTVCVGEAAVSA